MSDTRQRRPLLAMTLSSLLAIALLPALRAAPEETERRSLDHLSFPSVIYPDVDAEYNLEVARTSTRPASVEYALFRDGDSLWQREFEFEIHAAIVLRDGVLLGYGYRAHTRASTELVVFTIDTDGAVTLLRSCPTMCPDNEPCDLGFIGPVTERFAILRYGPGRVAGREEWLVIDPIARTTEIVVPELEVLDADLHWIGAVVPVTDTPLVLCSQYGFTPSRGVEAHHSLVRMDGRVCWRSHSGPAWRADMLPAEGETCIERMFDHAIGWICPTPKSIQYWDPVSYSLIVADIEWSEDADALRVVPVCEIPYGCQEIKRDLGRFPGFL